MVEPEIVHDLLELAIAVDGARDFGHREFFDDALRFPAVVGDGARDGVGIDAEGAALASAAGAGSWQICFRLRSGLLHRRDRLGVGGRCRFAALAWFGAHVLRNDCRGGIAARLSLLFGFLLGLFLLGIIREKLLRRHFQRGICVEPRFDCFVVDGIWIELLIDPFCEAHLADALDVAGARAVGEAIQRVEDGFVGGKFGDRQAF